MQAALIRCTTGYASAVPPKYEKPVTWLTRQTSASVGGQQWRNRIRFLEVFHDGHGLDQRAPVVEHQRRNGALRIDRPKRRIVLLVFSKIDLSLLRRYALKVQDDPHAKSSQRTP